MEGDYSLFSQVLPHGPISIHSLRMEGDPVVCVVSLGTIISIHSLRMEGDALHPFSCWSVSISIHSLRMEGDTETP